MTSATVVSGMTPSTNPPRPRRFRDTLAQLSAGAPLRETLTTLAGSVEAQFPGFACVLSSTDDAVGLRVAGPLGANGVPQGPPLWSAPLLVGADRVVGAFEVFGDDGALGTADVADLECACGLASTALAIARVAAKLREATALLETRTGEYEALSRVVSAIARGMRPADLFDMVAAEVAEMLGVESGGVVQFMGDMGELVGSTMTGPQRPTTVWLSGPSAVGQVFRGSPTGRIDDYSLRDDPRSRMLAGLGYVAGVAAPVHVDGAPWGAVTAATTRSEPILAGAEASLVRFAHLVGVAIGSADRRDQIVTDAAATIFSGSLEMSSTLRSVAASAERALLADRATCYVHTPDQSVIEAVHTTASDPRERAFIEKSVGRTRDRMPLWQWLCEHDEPLMIVEDVATDPRVPDAMRTRLGISAYLMAKLEHQSIMVDGEKALLGTLVVAYQRARRFSTADITALQSLANLAGLALANARLHEQTVEMLRAAEQRAATDPLTGLANHRTFHERLRQEVARATRHGRRLGLVVLDLDHFKGVNDHHGHQVGDDVLVETARRLQACARKGDLVGRVGGEEFAWIVPETEGLGAWQAAERARTAIKRMPFPVAGNLTISAGVADMTMATSADDLYRFADGALYWAKGHGRDVVFRYSPEVVEVLSATEKAERLEKDQARTAIRVLARAVDAKDHSTRDHSERVAELASRIAERMDWDVARIALLREAGLLHDVGKIGIPDRILLKPGRLDPGEYEAVKGHAQLGAEMVSGILSPEQVTWVRSHHERFDGRGYPDGLLGAAIPEAARILAVADSVDVMTSERPYSSPIGWADALAECERESGKQFCPDVVSAITRIAEPPAPLGALPDVAFLR
ncbi:MAG: diguanylate cyclase [Actinobacteria bacterium]|nr:diguanylate cyclase [Actinomycetota bacterium]